MTGLMVWYGKSSSIPLHVKQPLVEREMTKEKNER
jgi:hypothetical protein